MGAQNEWDKSARKGGEKKAQHWYKRGQKTVITGPKKGRTESPMEDTIMG